MFLLKFSNSTPATALQTGQWVFQDFKIKIFQYYFLPSECPVHVRPHLQVN